jgi:hypothetical protein
MRYFFTKDEGLLKKDGQSMPPFGHLSMADPATIDQLMTATNRNDATTIAKKYSAKAWKYYSNLTYAWSQANA